MDSLSNHDHRMVGLDANWSIAGADLNTDSQTLTLQRSEHSAVRKRFDAWTGIARPWLPHGKLAGCTTSIARIKLSWLKLSDATDPSAPILLATTDQH